jgi:pyrroline-5-carboxylate reductase
MPNIAIAEKQSMTFVSSHNAREEHIGLIMRIFDELGKTKQIDEKLLPAATALASCGIAYAFRYIRAAMEGGVEMGLYPHQAKEAVMQTLLGAVKLLEANNSHPEVEIDKVTTAGGITIKGLNEMENAGFTSAVIRGLKAGNVK